METEERLRLVHCTFNPTNKCLYVATSSGFRVLRLKDGSAKSVRDSPLSLHFPGGLSLVVSLNENPLVAMVGAATSNDMPNSLVYFFNDSVGTKVGDYNMHKPVLNLLMRRDRFIAVFERSLSVFSLSKLSFIASFDTCPNPTGVAAISYDSGCFVLAMLDITQGGVRVHNFHENENKAAAFHQSAISLLAVDFSGKLCATASQLGTVIRVFNCKDMAVLHELRRGRSQAQMTSLSFSPSLEYLCGISDHCTLHIWKLQAASASIVGGILSTFVPSAMFSPSIAKLRINQAELRTEETSKLAGPVAFFTNDDEIAVAGLDGFLHRVSFDAGACSLVSTDSLCYLEERILLRQSMFEPSV